MGAKRYGLDVKGDLEKELRLRRIEEELSRKVSSNIDATVKSRGAGSVPQVTGLARTGSNPGTVTVAWNPVQNTGIPKSAFNLFVNLAASLKKVENTFIPTISTDKSFKRLRSISSSFSEEGSILNLKYL